jgi:hypothetical protein
MITTNIVAFVLIGIGLACSMQIKRVDNGPITWNSPELQQVSLGLDNDATRDFEHFVMFMKK